MGIVAGRASTDATLYVLNGVCFTPEAGGMAIATPSLQIEFWLAFTTTCA